MIVKQVCERVSFALQKVTAHCMKCGWAVVCVFVGVVVAQCLVKFTWVYL